MKFTALLHHITPSLLVESFYDLKRNAAAGVDGVTWRDYENLSWERFRHLVNRYIPSYRSTHPYPEQRFRVTHPRQEPCAVIPLAGICAGGRG